MRFSPWLPHYLASNLQARYYILYINNYIGTRYRNPDLSTDDYPAPDSLRFIAKSQLEKTGYAEYGNSSSQAR